MKKIIFFIIVVVFGSCKKNNSKKPYNKEKEIIVKINKNVETIGIILDLSDLGDYILNNGNKNYELVKLIRKKFREYKHHSAVLKVNELSTFNMIGFGEYYYGLSFSELPEFKQIHPIFNEFLKCDSLTKEQVNIKLKEFNKSIRDFYKDAELKKFFSENKDIYNKIINEVQENVPVNIIPIMEGFFGEYSNKYIIIPSPTIFDDWNFGPKIENNLYYITGPSYDLKPNRKTFEEITKKDSLGFNDRANLTDLAIHEFGHSFVRFLDKKKNKNLIEKLSYLNTDELKKNLKKIGEGTEWLTGFEEHLVRANEIIIWRKSGNQKRANEKLKYEREVEGFIYINEFVNSLEKYVNNRKKYPTFESYFTKLINDLSKSKRQITVPNNS